MKEARAAREAQQQQQNFYRNFDADPFSSSSSSGSSSRRNGRGGYKDQFSSSSSSSSEQDALLSQTADGYGDGKSGKFGGGGRRGNERQDLVRKVMGKHTPHQEQVCVHSVV
jgi:hypothetical protein